MEVVTKLQKLGTGAYSCSDAKFHLLNKILYFFQLANSKPAMCGERITFSMLFYLMVRPNIQLFGYSNIVEWLPNFTLMPNYAICQI
jgi:hypothetical protein